MIVAGLPTLLGGREDPPKAEYSDERWYGTRSLARHICEVNHPRVLYGLLRFHNGGALCSRGAASSGVEKKN